MAETSSATQGTDLLTAHTESAAKAGCAYGSVAGETICRLPWDGDGNLDATSGTGYESAPYEWLGHPTKSGLLEAHVLNLLPGLLVNREDDGHLRLSDPKIFRATLTVNQAVSGKVLLHVASAICSAAVKSHAVSGRVASSGLCSRRLHCLASRLPNIC